MLMMLAGAWPRTCQADGLMLMMLGRGLALALETTSADAHDARGGLALNVPSRRANAHDACRKLGHAPSKNPADAHDAWSGLGHSLGEDLS